MAIGLAAVATAGLILVAAKAHGRQVRLEREQQGYFRVDFGAKNPAAVEAIWRTDRWLLWPTAAAVGVSLTAYGWFFGVLGLFVLGLPLGFACGFVVAGLASWARMARRDQGPIPWRRRALKGSVGWWLAVAAAAALVAWALA